MNDEQILKKIKENDMQAFKILMDKYSRRLFFLIYRFVGNYEDTEEIIQEVWFKFFKNIDKFRNESSIYTFVYRIALNLSINFVNHKKVVNKFRSMLKFFQIKEDDPMEEVYRKELIEILKECIDNLPSKQRKVFILREEEKLDFERIARILKISESSAKSNYHYALKNLRKFLIKKGVKL